MKSPAPAHEAAARNALRSESPVFVRDSVIIGLTFFLLAAAAILVMYQNAVQTKINEALAHLRPQAEYLTSQMDPRAHAWLASPDQTSSQPFTVLTQRLQSLRQYFPTVGRLFTGRYQNGKLYVILDTYDPQKGSSERHYVARPLGLDLPADSPEIKAIQDRQIYVSDNPAFKGEGKYLGVIVPLANPNMGVRDFLYLDSSYAPVAASVATARKARDIALLLAALLAVISGSTVFSWRCQSCFKQALAVSKLRDNEELFRSTYEMSPVAMCLTSTEGKLLRANRAFCDLLGYTEAELMRLEPAEYTFPEDSEKELPLLQNLKMHQAAQYQIERRYKRKGGTSVWGLASVAIVRDGDANISHYMTQVVNISERKEAEDTLRLSSERLALAADAGKVGMWDYDIATGRVVWNEVMHAIFHTDPATFPATFEAQEKFIHSEDREAVKTKFQTSLREGAPYEQEYRIVLSDGSVRYLKAGALVLSNENAKPVRAVGTIIDITVEKEEAEELIRAKEAAQAADKAKSEFIAMMSHELRTPLNGVLGFVSMLKNTPLDSEQLSYIETMETSGQGLLTLVNDILDLSKMDAKEIHVDASTFEVRPFIRKIHQQLQAVAYEKELHYDFFIEYSVPKTIHTDSVRLGQILTNILGNALKFTEHGRVELQVSAKPLGLFQKNWEWHFTIIDTGPGIPTSALPNLFKLFYQVDSSATRRHGGTGLGLAISQRLAKLLGGEIRVRSEVDEGTEFTVVIVAPRDQPVSVLPNIIPSRPLEGPSRRVQGKRILVVEDNPVNRKLCALQLKRLGCDTDFAETGKEAVEKIRNSQFDAVLMDMQLPDLDGCGATREIRREEREGERLSIIALTANALPEDRKRCLDAGMDDFLSKPLQYETLAATLSKWV